MKMVLGLVICSLMLVGCGKKTAKVDNKTDIDKSGNAEEKVVVEKISFTDIKLSFDGGITTLEAIMTNNTKENKSFVVNISLIDNSGKEVKNLSQAVDNLEAERKQKLQTGIIGHPPAHADHQAANPPVQHQHIAAVAQNGHRHAHAPGFRQESGRLLPGSGQSHIIRRTSQLQGGIIPHGRVPQHLNSFKQKLSASFPGGSVRRLGSLYNKSRRSNKRPRAKRA